MLTYAHAIALKGSLIHLLSSCDTEIRVPLHASPPAYENERYPIDDMSVALFGVPALIPANDFGSL